MHCGCAAAGTTCRVRWSTKAEALARTFTRRALESGRQGTPARDTELIPLPPRLSSPFAALEIRD